MDDQISKIFLIEISTRVEAQRRFRVLKDYLNFLAFENPQKLNFESSVEEFSKKYRDEDVSFLKTYTKDFYNLFNPQTLDSQLSKLESAIEGAKSITLYLPFETPDAEITKLGSWFKTNLGEATLFEIVYDPNLIGGCALSYNGIYKDYSLREKINQNKSKVIETLLSYKQ